MPTLHQMVPWIGFLVFVVAMLALDLFVFHRKAHEVKMREAISWSVVWIGIALAFNCGIYYLEGPQKALEFLTAYLIEKSLSVDNLFVFLLIFNYFSVPKSYQHGVLFWGIVGALVMRAIFIAMGVTLIHQFHWIIYVFGAILIFSGFRFMFEKDKELKPDRNPLLRLFKKFMPVTAGYEGDKFFVKHGKLFATPLFVVLLVVETTDIIFAVDSIPAVLAISHDPFIVFTSNVFAILGLRALYFALAGVMGLFHYLHYGLALILIFVGGKMLISDIYKVPIGVSLGGVVALLSVSIIASLMLPQEKKHG